LLPLFQVNGSFTIDLEPRSHLKFCGCSSEPPSGESPHPADVHSPVSYFARPQLCQYLSDCASAAKWRSQEYAQEQMPDVKYGSYDASTLFITPYFT